ncbi:YheV family putative metal-binding protein [Acinetobacter qingfengensis]|uniref:Metal-binding protein n=1 Tax=Acinetobacter qingfengensis TaxID=1262585 RepID=A0A1E7QXF7_9GAMM|nr:YheV family putative zinc ribbon protein [Acinetobacter qingfengensis]KAA8731666.1 YheV family putative metal-binding protein [Acinetobacter qingfengensis]OEY91768.1 metal-binding protein [Acinetobacter qingfengensis]
MKRRFIAGAKCPKCQAQDRIVMISTENDEWIECIECDYTDKRPTEVDYEAPAVPDEIGVIQFRPRKK